MVTLPRYSSELGSPSCAARSTYAASMDASALSVDSFFSASGGASEAAVGAGFAFAAFAGAGFAADALAIDEESPQLVHGAIVRTLQMCAGSPQAVREMRLGECGLVELGSSSDEGDDTHALDKYAGVDRQARDGVYALLYSVIMLNTDLNNPAITPKITLPEYVASCHRCTPLRNVPEIGRAHV